MRSDPDEFDGDVCKKKNKSYESSFCALTSWCIAAISFWVFSNMSIALWVLDSVEFDGDAACPYKL